MHQSYSPPRKAFYRSEIDGLRAFAVLSVIAFHAFPYWLKGGFVGVDIFFVISGFLITTHIFESFENGQFNFVNFFSRRIRRIFPALILVMLCSLIFGWFVLLADEYNELGKHIVSSTVFITNFIFAHEDGYFDTFLEPKPMLHLWSLAVEEQFYIFWPITLWVAWKLKQNLLIICLLVMSASFLINILWIGIFPTEIFFWPFGRFWELLVGSILAWAMFYKVNNISTVTPQAKNKSANLKYILSKSNNSGATTLIGIFMLLSSVIFINKDYLFPSYIAIFPLLGAVLIIIGGSYSSLSKFMLSNKFAVWFGLISYPLYLWHWPILAFLHIIEDGTPHRSKRIIAVVLAVILAWFTYQFVEKPIRYGAPNKSLRTITLVGMFLLIGLIAFTISSYDFKNIKTVDNVKFRIGLEHRIGASSRWFSAKDGWLFLGNTFERKIEKLKLTSLPSQKEIIGLNDTFQDLSTVGETTNTKIILLVGPNKSSIYGEKLPSEISVSSTRYVNFFLNKLRNIKNLTIYDPTSDLIDAKPKEGSLYFKAGTHYTNKGAYLSFVGLMKKLNIIPPRVTFNLDLENVGDIENGIADWANLKDYQYPNDENWNFSFDEPNFKLKVVKSLDKKFYPAFGQAKTVINDNPISEMKVWVIGDSFTTRLRPFLERTFAEVHYKGHWNKKLNNLSFDLENASIKPNLILVVRVERSF